MGVIIRTSNATIRLDALLDPTIVQLGRLTITGSNHSIITDLHPDSVRLLRDALDALLRHA